jgi:2,3-bisphosphoglycerate-independent phosphoglycerate mutase
MQDLPRINDAIATADRARAGAGRSARKLKQSGGTCHLIGLVSPGGVHSHQDHAAALAKILKDAGVPALVHAITDGRDTPPQSAAGYFGDFIAALPASVPIATVDGRYYAMDRDKRWAVARLCGDRGGRRAALPGCAGRDRRRLCAQALRRVHPAVGDRNYRGMRDGDGVLCFNFRADRVREILGAMLDPGFAVSRANALSALPRRSAWRSTAMRSTS